MDLEKIAETLGGVRELSHLPPVRPDFWNFRDFGTHVLRHLLIGMAFSKANKILAPAAGSRAQKLLQTLRAGAHLANIAYDYIPHAKYIQDYVKWKEANDLRISKKMYGG